MSESNNRIRNQLMESGRFFEVVEILEEIRNYDNHTFLLSITDFPERWTLNNFCLYESRLDEVQEQVSILLAIITSQMDTYSNLSPKYLKEIRNVIRYKSQKSRIDYTNSILNSEEKRISLRYIENLDLILIMISKIIEGDDNNIVPEKYYLQEETSNNERNK